MPNGERIGPAPVSNIRVEMNTAAWIEAIDSVRFDAMAAAIERITRRRAELADEQG